MKIGIDCRLWNETGVGRYIRNLVEQLQVLDKTNNYILFVLSKDYEKFKVQSSKFKVKVADVRWHTFEEQIKFRQILNRENLDLVHFPYFSVPVFYNKPFIVTIHDLIVNHFPTGKASTLPLPIYNLKLLAYKFVLNQTVRKARKIIAVSNATKNEIIDHLKVDARKIAVTYEGIDDKIRNTNIEIRNKSLNTKYKILNTKYFLYVGNAYPHKNLDRMLEAFSKIKTQKSKIKNTTQNLKLILIGGNDFFYERLKKKTLAMGLSSDVQFLGKVSDKELGFLYQNALALIMPSLMEGFGLPALEAMANKCLVLASDISALREICGDAAIYFDPYKVKDITQKMNEVCFNDLNHFSEKIKKGLERVRLFSWRKMAEETLAVYEEAA